MREMEKEILRLFKGYLGKTSEGISKEGLKYGLLIPDSASKEVVNEAIKMYGKDGLKWNRTFHKDFEIVKNAPMEDLIIQQMVHYITTYGFESLGIYSADMVYISKEELNIPELDVENIELIPILPLTKEELSARLMKLVTSGIALSKQTVEDIIMLSDFIDKDKFDDIKNREIATTLYHKYNIMPRDPEKFLRLLIFELTGNTLKIQNRDTIRALEGSNKAKALKLLKSYIGASSSNYERLSSIFLRNKNLFLSLKVKKYQTITPEGKAVGKEINAIINKLRKLAKTSHKPLKAGLLDCLTNKDISFKTSDLNGLLDGITIFREIRILNGVLYRLYGADDIVYKIRNGKTYVTKLEPKTPGYIERLKETEAAIRRHLAGRLESKVKDKTVYIPSNVSYAAPTSEKQFVGNIPSGSYVTTPRLNDMVYGVRWANLPLGKQNAGKRYYGETNPNEERVDLDLKQMNESAMFGWDASYRSQGGRILFSGDMTDAPLPQGATELFYVGKNYKKGAFLVTLNMFTSNSCDVPFEFVIASAPTGFSDTRSNYVLDPNSIIEKANMVIEKDKRQKALGLVVVDDNIKFYFGGFDMGTSGSGFYSTARLDNISKGTFHYLVTYNDIQVRLADLLRDAGAKFVDKPMISTKTTEIAENGDEIVVLKDIPVDIDLSLNSVSKDIIINIFEG